jgi:hypothetical protein
MSGLKIGAAKETQRTNNWYANLPESLTLENYLQEYMSRSIPEEKCRAIDVSFFSTPAVAMHATPHSVIPPFSNVEFASAPQLQRAVLGDFAKDGFIIT